MGRLRNVSDWRDLALVGMAQPQRPRCQGAAEGTPVNRTTSNSLLRIISIFPFFSFLVLSHPHCPQSVVLKHLPFSFAPSLIGLKHVPTPSLHIIALVARLAQPPRIPLQQLSFEQRGRNSSFQPSPHPPLVLHASPETLFEGRVSTTSQLQYPEHGQSQRCDHRHTTDQSHH